MKKHKTNKAKRVSRSCRNNGYCYHCVGNRTYQSKKGKQLNDEYYKSYVTSVYDR